MNIGKRIKQLRGERSVQDCADAIGVTRSAWYQWEEKEDDQSIKGENMLKLARFFGISIEEFASEQPSAMPRVLYSRGNAAREPAADYDDEIVLIPFVDAQVGAGPGVSNGDERTLDLHQYSRTWIERNGLHAPALRRVKVTGDSMRPTIFDGDVALVNTAERKITNGKVFAFIVDGEARVKRLFKQFDGRIRVVSDNPDKLQFPDEFLTPDHMPEMVGRVVDRSGKADL